MKGLTFTLICCIAVSLSLAATTDAPAGQRRVFLSVVLDTSPTGSDRWHTRKSLLVEAIHSLQAGDRVELLTARPGRPTVQLAETITEPLQLQRERAAGLISRIPKEWLVSADMGRAVNAAHLRLLNKGDGYRSCLLVLGSGRLSKGSLAEVQRVAASLKPRGWPMCVICDGTQAYRSVLVAGNKSQFELRFTDSASVAQWIRSVRTPTAPQIAGIDGDQARPTPASPAAKPEKPLRIAPPRGDDADVARAEPTAQVSAGSEGAIDVRIVNMPPLARAPERREQGPSPLQRTESSRSTTSSRSPATSRQQSPKLKAAGEKPFYRRIPLGIVGGGLLGVGLVGLLAYVLKDSLAVGKLGRRDGREDDGAECVRSHLVAFIGDRREELGYLEDIREITIGKGLGSHIYIDEPSVEDRHARIFRRRKHLRVQNTASMPITVGGVEIAPRGKLDLMLPADLELTPGVTVSLLTEPVELEMEVDDDENDAA